MYNVPSYGREIFEETPIWLAPADVSEMKNCHFRIRKSFQRDWLLGSKLYICAESYYSLYINGIFIGRGPARGTYSCNFVDEYAIEKYLVDGENYVAAEVFCNNFPTFLASPAEPAIFIKIGDYVADDTWQVQLAEDWKTEDLPVYTKQIGSIEWRDWRLEPVGWKSGRDSSKWQNAAILSADNPIYNKKLFKRDVADLQSDHIKPIKLVNAWITTTKVDIGNENIAEIMSNEQLVQYSDIKKYEPVTSDEPITITPSINGDGVALIFDFGQYYVGGIELDIDAADGMILDVGYDEVPEGNRLKTARDSYHFADRHILRNGRQRVSNYLHWRGGRYVQLVLRNMRTPVTIYSLAMLDQRYPANFANFKCSDENLNELWKRCATTMSTCAIDTFTDCPWREIAFWVNDFLVQQEFWQQLSGKTDLIKRSFALALSQPISTGLIPGVCPFDGNESHVLFATNLFMPIILKDYEVYSGDGEFVDSVLPTVTDIFEKCQSYIDETGIMYSPEKYWNFTDWSYGLSEQFRQYSVDLNGSGMCIVNWFNVLAAKSLSCLYGDRDTIKSNYYKGIANKASQNIIKQFWNAKANRFNEFPERDDIPASKVSHALAILSGMLDESMKQACLEAIVSDECLTPELYMMHFLFKVFAENNMYEQIQRAIKDYWMPMLLTDCPTIWEANVHQHGKAAFNNAGSMCHAFALAPVSFMRQEILGIKPLDKGYKKFQISPKNCDLKWAKGTIPTPEGDICISWTKKKDTLYMSLEIPKGLKAILKTGEIIQEGIHKLIMREEYIHV